MEASNRFRFGYTPPRPLKVSVGGLGSIGSAVLRELAKSERMIEVVAVCGHHAEQVRSVLGELDLQPDIRDLKDLHVGVDIVVECLPGALFSEIADPTIAAGKTLLALSAAALLCRDDLLKSARCGKARILVPTGAIGGLDAVRAMRREGIRKCQMITRKPPMALEKAPYVVKAGLCLGGINTPALIFKGSAREGARGFPDNVNVVAALALATVGPDDTECEIWADPHIRCNVHQIEVESLTAKISLSLSSMPSEANARTSAIAALSVVDALRSFVETLRIGS